jgi:flagellar hook-associated protein 3 FlgL
MSTEIRGVSTSAFFERSNLSIGALRTRAEELQAQIGRGERLSRSSDDPVAASRLRILARADSLSAIDTTNADRANSDLQLADDALSSFGNFVIRAKELATLAASGTLTNAQRAGIGEELAQMHGDLVSLANSRNSAGHSLFGGEATGLAYTVDTAGNASYVGTASAGQLALGEGQSVNRGLTGPEFLNFAGPAGPTNLMATVKALADALQGGAADPAAAARAALDPLESGLQSITTGQTVVGSRLAWIELTTQRRETLGELRAGEQTDIGATDIAETVARLQETMLVLEASQASFARLSRLSLFDALG